MTDLFTVRIELAKTAIIYLNLVSFLPLTIGDFSPIRRRQSDVGKIGGFNSSGDLSAQTAEHFRLYVNYRSYHFINGRVGVPVFFWKN